MIYFLIVIYVLCIYVSLPGLLKRSGTKWYYGLIPGLNFYYLFKLLSINNLIPIIYILIIILLPFKEALITLGLIFLPFIVLDPYENNVLFPILAIPLPFIIYPFVGYFHGVYNYDGKNEFFRKKKLLIGILIIISAFVFINFTYSRDYIKNTDFSNPHYINELTGGSDRIYNEHLSKKEQMMYDYLLNLAKNHTMVSTFKIKDFGCKNTSECGRLINNAFEAIWVDRPELLNFSIGSWEYDFDTIKIRMNYSYYLPLKDVIGIFRIENRIGEIKEATKNMNDKEKIIYVYNWMGKNNYYDSTFVHDSKNQSAYNVFVKGNAVCAGFAKASHMIFSQIGIESYIISGYSTGPHMWNIVKYNDKYYYFDSTVSVSIGEKYEDYHYKGLTQTELAYYKADYPHWYPEIEATNMFENFETN